MRIDDTQIFPDVATDDAAMAGHVRAALDEYWPAIDRRQRDYLRGLTRRAFPYRRPVQHDFACGTGRAIRLLHGLVRGAHGYDSRPAMLTQAHQADAHAMLHLIHESGPVPAAVPTDPPGLVTVFRLLDMDDAVRDRAIAFAAQVLPHRDAGLLILENHGNARSLRRLQHARHGDKPWFAELSHEEVTALLDRHGFTVVERRGFTLFTQGWYARRRLRPIAAFVDGLVTRSQLAGLFCVDVLYVARRARPGLGSAASDGFASRLDSPAAGSPAWDSPAWGSPAAAERAPEPMPQPGREPNRDPDRPRRDPDAESW